MKKKNLLKLLKTLKEYARIGTRGVTFMPSIM